jgi:DNA helicase IV
MTLAQKPGKQGLWKFPYVVAVDEATDFSAVELACMRLLSHPAFDSTAFTGDLMQRMTSQGIKNWKEVEDLVSPFPEIYDLKVVYRQSQKLLQIAAQLYQQTIGEPAPFSAGYAGSPSDPDALWFSSESRQNQSLWIIKRIGELHRIWGEMLPVAVFVPSEADVSPTAELLRTLLFEDYGIQVEACLEGRILGTQANVRVFSVQFIKGLEFEAVFFVGADHMAAASPELVDRFLYVGLTRARNFLAVVTFGEFPKALSHVREFFKQGTWEHLVPPQNPTDI